MLVIISLIARSRLCAACETYVVELDGNPTTGYRWDVAQVDNSVLMLVGEPEYRSESDAVGAGGVFTFRFSAVGPGETDVQFVYRRPWEEDAEPLERFTVTVLVEDE